MTLPGTAGFLADCCLFHPIKSGKILLQYESAPVNYPSQAVPVRQKYRRYYNTLNIAQAIMINIRRNITRHALWIFVCFSKMNI